MTLCLIYTKFCFIFTSTSPISIVIARYKNYSMDLIVDIQCLKIGNNITVPKEIAVVALQGDFTAHWLVSPTSPIHTLSANIIKQNRWLTRHHHGLDYFDAESSLHVIYTALQEITKKASKIYVRVSDKSFILHKIIDRKFVNLEYNKDCPIFKKLSSDVYCIRHAIKADFRKYCCALNNDHRLKSWLALHKSRKGHGQSSNNEEHFAIQFPYYGCISSGSDSEGVDETDGIRCEHG